MVDRTSPLAAALIVAVSVTASVLVTLLLNPSDDTADAARPIGIDPERIERLESRVTELERTAPEMATDARSKPKAEPDANRNPIDANNDLLSLARLEKRIHELETSVRPKPHIDYRVDPADEAKRVQSRLEIIRMAQDVIMGLEASEKDKVNAHGALRRIDDAYTPGMARTMIDIGRNSEDPSVRAQVWTLFDGSSAAKLPELIPALSDTVFQDASASVRAEAAETLGNFPLNDRVIAILEQVAENDQDANVRRKAARTLIEMKLERAQNSKGR